VPKGKRGAAQEAENKTDAQRDPAADSTGSTLTVPELAEHLRVHPTTIYRLLRAGRIPAIRAGNSWRFDRAAINKWESDQTASSEVESPAPSRKGRKARSRPG
jgi:excisionase family DNA binding protein